MESAGEEEVIGLQARLLDPRLQGIPGCRRDLELDRALGLVLQQEDGACRHPIPMTNISDFQGDEIAATQLAVDTQVEKCELAHPVFHLEANTERPWQFICVVRGEVTRVPRSGDRHVGPRHRVDRRARSWLSSLN